MGRRGEAWGNSGHVGSTKKREMESSDVRPTTPPMREQEPVCPWAPFRPTFARRTVNEAQGAVARSLYNNED